MCVGCNMKMGLLLLFIISLAATAHADTVDMWHVYINTVKQRDFSEGSKKRDVRIWTSSIVASDSIIIKYYTDAPCKDCDYELQVTDDKKKRILTYSGKSTSQLKGISLQDLLRNTQRTGMGTYHVHFVEGKRDVWFCDLQMK